MKMYKKDGTEIEVNNNSLEHALSIGWTKTKAKSKAKSKKKAK